MSGHFVDRLHDEARIDGARRDDRYADVVAFELVCECERKSSKTKLGCRVSRLILERHAPSQRGHADDRSRALREHVRKHQPREKQRTAEVDVQDLQHVFDGNVLQRPPGVEAGVVDENVDTPEPRLGLFE